ncbi:unnamed protein product [Pedinophyceae sp. YPF-701]|nr:unnamed protein product [Pedinophyceae sp. YPF-701]
MVRHNNVIPNQHFKKKWQFMVRTWFNQPARKVRRRAARAEKAAKIAPRPTGGCLKPVVRGQTVKYNLKQRLGRGFTLDELKEAGLSPKVAQTVGISVDHRRRNRSVEGMQANVERLKEYKAKLVVFPKNAKKPKAGDSSAADCAAATQLTGTVLPLAKKEKKVEFAAITADMKAKRAYATLRLAQMNQRRDGQRKKAAEEAAAAEKAK